LGKAIGISVIHEILIAFRQETNKLTQMIRADKKKAVKYKKVRETVRYPTYTIEAGSMALREEAQLCLLKSPIEKQGLLEDLPAVSGRYPKNGSTEKVLGAVYTPPRVAAALTRWAVRAATDEVLDPSCGEGVFLSAARTRLADLGARKPQCVGVDIHPQTAALAGAVCDDFFSWVQTAPKFDVIIGNPPFIRSHLFAEASRALAFAKMMRLGLKPSRLMSTWAPFLAICSHLLTKNGRLAMVIPEELLHVGYADGLREMLLRQFRRVIVCLPPHEIFPEVQQSVILLLCDNESAGESGLQSVEYAALEEGDFEDLASAHSWSWNSKWTHLFLSPSERQMLNEWWPQFNWQPFKSYGRVEVGVVTGDNAFFVLNQEQASRFDDKHLMPIVSGAKDLRGIKFDMDDFRRVLLASRPGYLLKLDEPISQLPKSIRSYLEEGQQRKVNGRYKCRIREPWYAVPSARECDALLLRQAGDMPRLVHLSKKCTATDTVHRVNWQRPSLGKRHTASFMNTWTLLAGELTGRSYGGGVLELMPSEANNLPLPEPVVALDGIFDIVDERVRSRSFFDALALVDEVVMPDWMSAHNRQTAENILIKLINRRKTHHHADH
jgi:adenine-specific DNA-methyltransferase